MADKNLEMKIYVDGPIHTAFMELAEECMRQGVQINNVSFNWFSAPLISARRMTKPILLSVHISSEKEKEKANGR